MAEVIETRVDETFPRITVALAELVFAAIRPEVAGSVATLDETDAKQAWSRVVRMAGDLPFARLQEVLGRLERAEGSDAEDALYAFTWGIYHSRAEDQIFEAED